MIIQHENASQTYSPEYVYVRIPKGGPSDDSKSNGSPGDEANSGSSAPEFTYDAQSGEPVLVPPGMGVEIPMGSAMTPEGYRSAGLLVNYSPVQSSSAATAAMHWNHGPEVASSVSEYVMQDGQGLTIEKHDIVPQAVFRIRGWDSTSRTPVAWAGAQETMVEVYDPADYVGSSHTFTGQPHSYYRIEIATGNGLQDGVRLVQSNHGVVHTRSFQASGNGLVLRDVNGNHVTESTVVPPDQNTPSWQRQTTETTDGIVSSSLLETYQLVGAYYALVSSTQDPSAAANDELTNFSSYYSDGTVRSVSRPDGSWSFSIHSVNTTTTYSPWLSSSSLLYSNGVWSLPTSGMAVKTVSSGDSSGNSSQSYLVNLATGGTGVLMSGSATSISTDAGLTLTTHTESRSNEVQTTLADVSSYSLAYADDNTDRLLAGRTRMTWDATGRATLYQYDRGTWAAPEFTPDVNGTCVRAATITGYIANPGAGSTVADFTHVPSHSSKEVTITAADGVVREETHVCDSSGNYQPVLAKDHEYEPDGQHRPSGIKIAGIYLSKTEYISPTVTRQWDEDGTMTETETNGQGEVIRSTLAGNTAVPPVTTTFTRSGLTTTTVVGGRTLAVEVQDVVGRTVSSRDAIGAITTTTYSDGGSSVTRTAPGGVNTVDSRHYDGQPISTTGSGVIPQYYSSPSLPAVSSRRPPSLARKPACVPPPSRRTGTVRRFRNPRPIPQAAALRLRALMNTPRILPISFAFIPQPQTPPIPSS